MPEPEATPSVVDDTLDALKHDWTLMRAFIECEARATHYSDGTALSPRQRGYAAAVLTMLKHKEPTK